VHDMVGNVQNTPPHGAAIGFAYDTKSTFRILRGGEEIILRG
jgi:hypothetical protein